MCVITPATVATPIGREAGIGVAYGRIRSPPSMSPSRDKDRRLGRPPQDSDHSKATLKEFEMKRIIQAVVVSVLLSGAPGVWAFGVAAETNVGQGSLDSYAARHVRQGTLLSGTPSTPAVEA